MNKKTITGMAAALALGLLGMASAQASVVSSNSSASFADNVYTIDIAHGAASYSFDNAGPGGFFNYPQAAVKTGGSGLVAANSAFFGGGPAAFFTGSRAPFIDGSGGTLTTFQAFNSFATIDNSSVDTFIGLAFDLSDGRHYGYAEVSGTQFLGYGYETEAGVGIRAGAMGAAVPVPEPNSLIMLAFGLALVGAGTTAARRQKN